MVRVVVDSSSDVPKIVADSLSITIIPARILFGREVYLDREDMTVSEFYERLQTTRYHPLTTPASPIYMYRTLNEIAKTGEDILFICVSAKLSKFMENAKIALENITNVNWRLYDSTGTSMYEGLLAIQAAKMAQMNYTLDQIVARLNNLVPRTITYAIAATFDYLIRGGRVPLTRGKFGGALGLRLIIEINNGETHPVAKPRGLSAAIKEVITLVSRQYTKDEPIICAILDAENSAKAAELSNEMANNFNITEFYPAKIGATIGANIGPKAIGVSIIPSLESVL